MENGAPTKKHEVPAGSSQGPPAPVVPPVEQVMLEPAGPVRLPLWGVVAIPLGYALFIVMAQAIAGINYEKIGFTATNIFFAVIIPVSVGAAILVLITSILGWWPEVLRDTLPVRAWIAALPVGMALAALLIIDYFAVPDLGLGYVAAAMVATLLVGFSEELLTRGLLLTGLRLLTTERWAWLWSSLTFGALHILTALAGRALPLSLLQAATTFVLGTLLYLARRASGGIVVPMLLHALWDFALFTEIGARANGLALNYVGLVLGVFMIGALFLATIAAMVVIIRGKEAPPSSARLPAADPG